LAHPVRPLRPKPLRHLSIDLDAAAGQAISACGGEPFVGHTGDVETIEFSPDGKYMFTSSEDKTLRIWDVDAGRLLYTMVAFSDDNYVIFDPDQRYLASDGIRSALSSP
jgi:WD40 repeat protein